MTETAVITNTVLWEEHLEDWTPVHLDMATRAHFRSVVAAAQKSRPEASHSRRGIAAGDWLLEGSEELQVAWGTEDAPLALEDEGLMIVGPQGVGKSTIAQQFALALAGLRDTCLGLR